MVSLKQARALSGNVLVQPKALSRSVSSNSEEDCGGGLRDSAQARVLALLSLLMLLQ